MLIKNLIKLTVITLTSLAMFNVYALKGNIDDGKLMAAGCAACHGADGNSTGETGPNLAGQNARYFTEQILAFQEGPDGPRYDPVMYGLVSDLSAQDIANLAAYYETLTPAHGQADPELVELGQLLYRGGDLERNIPGCGACHGPSGVGNAQGGFAAIGGQHANYTIKQLKDYRDGKRQTDAAGIMRDIASKMSDEEINAVASYIQGLH